MAQIHEGNARSGPFDMSARHLAVQHVCRHVIVGVMWQGHELMSLCSRSVLHNCFRNAKAPLGMMLQCKNETRLRTLFHWRYALLQIKLISSSDLLHTILEEITNMCKLYRKCCPVRFCCPSTPFNRNAVRKLVGIWFNSKAPRLGLNIHFGRT